MCSLAPRAAAPGFGATAFLDRQRGVVAAMAPAATRGHNAGQPTRRGRDSEVSAAPARKRGRDDGFEHVVDPAASSALRSRMDAELVALQGLLKRAKLLPRSSPSGENKYAPAPRRPEAPAVSSAAKRRASPSPSKSSTATEVAYGQQRPAEAAAAAPGPACGGGQDGSSEEAATGEEEKELARAAAREELRQMLLEMEKSALLDETIYPEDLEELGIPFEFVVTRTWKQALEDHAKKVEFVGV